MVNLKERRKKRRERYESTGKLERLGFCPNCTNGDVVSMMWFLSEYDNGLEWLGRVCPNCGYVNWYHTDVISSFRDTRLDNELMKTRGPHPKMVKLEIWHGEVLGIPSLEQTFEKKER